MVALMLMGMMATGVEAQVSVRRGGQRKSEQKKETRRVETDRGSESTETVRTEPRTDQTPKVVRSTTATKTKAVPKTEGGVSLRQQIFDEYQRQNSEYTPWQHVIYRELDMNDGQNASLYYPVEPMDGLTNMFRVLLSAMCEGKLSGYEYLDGREVFSDKYRIKTEEMLDKFQIAYRKEAADKTRKGETAGIVIDETDVPCHEVMSYYIKERWEFNSQTGSFGPRVLAICPVLHRAGDFGGEPVRYPMFWIDYEDVRPLLRQYQIMSDGMNNAPRYTMEDFFTLNQYAGEIYKVQNTRGLTLAQQYPNADTLKVVRRQIEERLHSFSDGIWVPNDPEDDNGNDGKKVGKGKRQSEADGTETRRNRRTKEVVEVKDNEDAAASAADDRKPRHSAVRRR